MPTQHALQPILRHLSPAVATLQVPLRLLMPIAVGARLKPTTTSQLADASVPRRLSQLLRVPKLRVLQALLNLLRPRPGTRQSVQRQLPRRSLGAAIVATLMLQRSLLGLAAEDVL